MRTAGLGVGWCLDQSDGNCHRRWNHSAALHRDVLVDWSVWRGSRPHRRDRDGLRAEGGGVGGESRPNRSDRTTSRSSGRQLAQDTRWVAVSRSCIRSPCTVRVLLLGPPPPSILLADSLSRRRFHFRRSLRARKCREVRLRSALAGTYTFERGLGGGGMSRVFLATESSLGRQVVIKVLPPQLAEGVSTERFTREIRLAAKLQHPHIVPLLSAGEVNGLPWFAMPFVEGESLRMKLRRSGELPVSDVLRVLREVASALAYAHTRGVVHRDIKPENILLSGGTAMVSDFGVAKAIVDAEESTGTGLTSLGIALGTPAYMAPEQGMADPRMDQRADVYAFGVVAYELLAGRTPFQGRSPQATLAAHVTEVPEPVERLRGSTPPALASLVMQCLAKSPADRPQSAQELVQAIDALTTPSGGTAPHIAASVVTTPHVTSSGAARNGASRKLIALAAGILVLALGGWYASTRLRTPDISERRIAVAPFENLTGDPQFDVVGRMAAD